MNPMKLKTIYSCALIILSAGVWMACDPEHSGSGPARVEVRLTDAPGDYDAVTVDVKEVLIHSSSGDTTSGWMSLDVNEGKYDLLQLTDGLDTLLGTAQIPAGRISEIRLILGGENTVASKGHIYDLKTPSAQQSGLKIKLDMDLKEGTTYTILLDFDAARSIVKTGKGSYNLKPVIRAITEVVADGTPSNPPSDTTVLANTGIKGKVQPPSAKPVIYAIVALDTVSTQADTVSGNFQIRGLLHGTYRVVIVPTPEFEQKEITGVQVLERQFTDVGIITLSH
jgi:hypothetical protein